MYDKEKACLTTELTRFRSCHPDCVCGTRDIPGVVHAKVAVAVPLSDILGKNAPLPLDTPYQRVTKSVDFKGNPLEVYEIDPSNRLSNMFENAYQSLMNSQYIRSRDGKCLLPCHIRYYFSRHSSFSEIYNFIKLFRPKQVYPFDHGIPGTQKLRMKEMFGTICSGDHVFRFDQERAYLESRTMQKTGLNKSAETNTHSSSDCSSPRNEGVADSLWNKNDSSDSNSHPEFEVIDQPPEVQQEKPFTDRQEPPLDPNMDDLPATPPPTFKPNKEKTVLPLYGNTNLNKPQQGWNLVDQHGRMMSTKMQVYANTESNFKTPPSSPGIERQKEIEQPMETVKINKAKFSRDDEYSQENDYGELAEKLFGSSDSEEENEEKGSKFTPTDALSNPPEDRTALQKSNGCSTPTHAHTSTSLNNDAVTSSDLDEQAKASLAVLSPTKSINVPSTPTKPLKDALSRTTRNPRDSVKPYSSLSPSKREVQSAPPLVNDPEKHGSIKVSSPHKPRSRSAIPAATDCFKITKKSNGLQRRRSSPKVTLISNPSSQHLSDHASKSASFHGQLNPATPTGKITSEQHQRSSETEPRTEPPSSSGNPTPRTDLPPHSPLAHVKPSILVSNRYSLIRKVPRRVTRFGKKTVLLYSNQTKRNLSTIRRQNRFTTSFYGTCYLEID